MIKKIIAVVLVVAAVATVGLVSADQYQKHQNKQAPVPTVTVAQKDAAVAKAVNDANTASAGEYESLQATALAECQKGAQAYAALTPALKTKTPAPNCSVLQK